MRKHKIENLTWKEVVWQRQFDLGTVWEAFSHLAALSPRGAVIWETRGKNGQITHLLGAGRKYIRSIEEALRAHGDIQFHDIDVWARYPVEASRQLKATHPSLSLKTDITESVIRAGLAALAEDKTGTETVLQIVLGKAFAPSPIPADLPDPHATWLQVILGDVGKATAESRKNVREKAEQQIFQANVRIGACGEGAARRIRSLLGALKTLESCGVRIHEENIPPEHLNTAHVPWHFPLQLSVKELANFLLLPAGEAELPGTPGLHPRLTLPPVWYGPNPPFGKKKRHGVSMPFLPDNIHLIAAHRADLLVDVTIAVDIVLLYVAWRYPSEYRIVNLTGVAVIRIVSACRSA